MELEISNKIANEKNKNNDVTKFMKELEQEKEKLEVASKNFPNELCKKLKLPTEYTEILEKKMEEYLKAYSCHYEVLYAGYDLKTDTYYQDQYYLGEKTRYEISKKKAEKWGIGSFHEFSTMGPEGDAPECSTDVSQLLKGDIERTIQKQQNDGKNIKDVDLTKDRDYYKGKNPNMRSSWVYN